MSDGSRRQQLPLFPLHTVLFPKMGLPLRVFEPRYRQMMDYCMERDRSFGVVLIRSGSEVGGPADPYRVGTVARIDEIEPQQDGTLAVSTTGLHRFAIVDMLQEQPFQVGLVEELPEDGPDAPGEVLAVVQGLARRCLEHTLALTGEWVRNPDLPADPADLSYLLSARLPADRRVKQRLLEAAAADRLRQLAPLLEREEQRLARQVQDQIWQTRVNFN